MLGLEIQDGGVPLDPLLTIKCEVKQVPEPFASQFFICKMEMETSSLTRLLRE